MAIGVILGVSGKNAPEGDDPIDQSDLSDLLAMLKSGDGVDLVRDRIRLVLQELAEAEFTQVIGAGRYERTGERITERDGRRPKNPYDQGRQHRGGDPQAAI